MPTIGCAPIALAACTTAKPTAPRPKTATEDMGSTLAVFQTAPSPVATPQPKRHDRLGSSTGLTLAHEISASTVYSANVEQPMKWKMVEPSDLRVKRDEPSGIKPLPWVPRILGQRLVFGEMQKMQSEPCARREGESSDGEWSTRVNTSRSALDGAEGLPRDCLG